MGYLKSVLLLILVVTFGGCQNHQAKIDSLQNQYKVAEAQFRKDCSSEMLSLPVHLSDKCVREQQQMNAAFQLLKQEQAK